MLNRLMGWTVFAIAHSIVGENVEHWKFHQRGQANRRSGIVAENEECGTVGTELRKCQPVYNSAHRVLANAIVDVFALRCACLEILCTLISKSGLVGRTKIRRPSDQPWNVLREHVQDLARCVSTCHAFRVCRKDGKVTVPSLRQLALLHLVDFGGQFGELGTIVSEELCPPSARVYSALADAVCKVFANTVRNQEFRVFRPAVGTLTQRDFIVSVGPNT